MACGGCCATCLRAKTLLLFFPRVTRGRGKKVWERGQPRVLVGVTPFLLHEVKIIENVPRALDFMLGEASAAKWQLRLAAQLCSSEDGSVLPACSG